MGIQPSLQQQHLDGLTVLQRNQAGDVDVAGNTLSNVVWL